MARIGRGGRSHPQRTPGAPTLSAAAGIEQVTLSWTTPTVGTGATLAYGLYRDNVGIAIIAAGNNTYPDTGLTGNTTYQYKILAANAVGNGPYSATVSATPTAVVVVPPPTVGQPTVPANTVAGLASSRVIGYGDQGWLFNGRSSWADYDSHGWDGFQFTLGHMPMGSAGPTYPYLKPSLATAAEGGPGGSFIPQYALQTGNGGGGGMAEAASRGWEVYAKSYFRDNRTQGGGRPDTDRAPFVNWYDDTIWAKVTAILRQYAQALAFLGMDGWGWDMEIGNGYSWYATGYTDAQYNIYGGPPGTSTVGPPERRHYLGNTHTTAENHAIAKARSLQIHRAMWEEFPAMNLQFYWSSEPMFPSGFCDIVQNVVNGFPNPNNLKTMEDWLEGAVEAHRVTGATGRIIATDANLFRLPQLSTQHRTAYQINNFGPRAYYSQKMSAANWLRYCNYLDLGPLTWHGGDYPAGGYQPLTDSAWSTDIDAARSYAEGIYHFEYTGPQEGWPEGPTGTGTLYSTPAAISALQAASSATPVISTTLPSLVGPAGTGGPTVTLSGGAATITCRAAHVYGVRYVKVYRGSTFSASNPEASVLGAMRMTWNQAGGTRQTNYDNSFQQCTFTTAAGFAAGDWLVLEVCSAKNDKRWTTVQVPGAVSPTRYFADSSPWNSQQGTGLTYTALPIFAAPHAIFPTSTDYSVEIVRTAAQHPMTTITAIQPSWGYPEGTIQLRIPPGTTAATGTDAHIVILDDVGDAVLPAGVTKQSNAYYDFWIYLPTGSTTANVSAWGTGNRVTGSGWANPTTLLGAGVRGGASALLGGCVLPGEMLNGIPHALALGFPAGSVPCPAAGYVSPAIGGDGSCEGRRFFIPQATAMPSGLSARGVNLFNCLKQYGAFSADTVGGGDAVLYFQRGTSSAEFPTGPDLNAITPLIRLAT
jgi:hypothetical protein